MARVGVKYQDERADTPLVMPPRGIRWLRDTLTRPAASADPALVALAVMLTAVIFALVLAVGRYGDAPLLFFGLPLAIGAVGWGLRGGIAFGVLTSSLAFVWWVAHGYPDGGAWVSSRVVTFVAIGLLLGWFTEKRHELTLEIAHHRQHSLDLIATASFDGYFTGVNPAFTRALGFSAEELLAEPFLSFVHPEDIEATLAAVAEQTELGHDVLNFQNRYRTTDGSYRWLEWTSAPQRRSRSLVAVARDVTDRKRLEALEREYHQQLENDVRERTWELEQRNVELEDARRETLYRLALAAEYRDDETFEHTARIGAAAGLVAAELGLDPRDVELIRDAAPLHDIGKLGVSDAVLRKPGRLTPDEVEHMRRHAELGARILSGSTSRVLQAGEEIALTHHEWWDGRGYPHGLTGDDIPLFGRIVALADVFDALTHERPYKTAWTVIDAVQEIRRLRGSQFDPRIVEAFERLDHDRLAGAERLDPRVGASATARAGREPPLASRRLSASAQPGQINRSFRVPRKWDTRAEANRRR